MSRRRSKPVLVECRDFPGRCRHHLTPKEHGGDKSKSNLLLMTLDKHAAYHRLFGNRSLEESIELLVRIHRIKGRCLYRAMGKPCNLAPCLADIPKNGHKKNGHKQSRQVFRMMKH